jgi:plastocyanin/heme-degrading monooxygenase HmoA
MSDHGAAHGADHGGDHGGHGAHGHGPERWETSMWPVAAALGAIVTGLCLVWNAKDGANDFAGPMAGAALVATIAAVGAWIWERKQRAAEEAKGADVHGENPKYTQVLTFTVPAGQLDAARAEGGVVSALEHKDLSEIPGYKDFRVTVAPSADGPSQVIVETTWEDHDGLAAYNASDLNLLAVLTDHEEQVLPGTVQAFDMEVVRDTKMQSYRFPMSAALAVVGGLVAGGFMFGAAQSIFVEESVVADAGPPENPYEIVMRDNSFNKDTLTAPPNTEVTYQIRHVGVNPHNLSFYDAPGGTAFLSGEIFTADGEYTETFTTPGPGTYYFQCDVHPTEMTGTFVVAEGAPPPGGAVPPPGETPAAEGESEEEEEG